MWLTLLKAPAMQLHFRVIHIVKQTRVECGAAYSNFPSLPCLYSLAVFSLLHVAYPIQLQPLPCCLQALNWHCCPSLAVICLLKSQLAMLCVGWCWVVGSWTLSDIPNTVVSASHFHVSCHRPSVAEQLLCVRGLY